MSDSDDTDVLLLIPPDLFIVPESDSDDPAYRHRPNQVVSQILDHIQSLETRLSAIELRDDSLELLPLDASSKTQLQRWLHQADCALPSTRHSPTDPLCRLPSFRKSDSNAWYGTSVMSSPSRCRSLTHIDDSQKYETWVRRHISNNNSRVWEWHDDSTIRDKLSTAPEDLHTTNFSEMDGCSLIEHFVGSNLTDRGLHTKYRAKTLRPEHGDNSKEMELSEVDKLLRQMEATEIELAQRIYCSKSHCHSKSPSSSNVYEVSSCTFHGHDDVSAIESSMNLQLADQLIQGPLDVLGFHCSNGGNAFNDASVLNKIGIQPENMGDSTDVPPVLDDRNKFSSCFGQKNNKNDESASNSDAQYKNDTGLIIREISRNGTQKSTKSADRHLEAVMSKSQRHPMLSNFWDCDDTDSQKEILQMILNEEKFCREVKMFKRSGQMVINDRLLEMKKSDKCGHCENVIQELQKRLLEEQEKVALAIRVDNEKNGVITQCQNAWSQLKYRFEKLENGHSKLEENIKNETDKHQSEIREYQERIKRSKIELSKANEEAAGYKKTIDIMAKEKLDLLKNHAGELEKYTSLVQEVNERYENLKLDYNILSDKGKKLDELGNDAQQELNGERRRSSQVRSEMAVIHKALDACETELSILRQEKENLILKLKEEGARNSILERNKDAIIQAMDDAKNAERAARDETKALMNRQEHIRWQLRKVYQNQLDDLVKTKLREFQQQLDAAELAFQQNLETRQRAIAECAARKIKSMIDKHQLEINLLEERHKEEKKLREIHLAQVLQKVAMIESQLNMQCISKIQLSDQLYSVMQKQWQQALQIISGGNMKYFFPLQRLNPEDFFDAKKSRYDFYSSSSRNLQSTNFRQEFNESFQTLTPNDGEIPLTTAKKSIGDLRRYIRMILDLRKPNDNSVGTKYTDQRSLSPPSVIREVPRKNYTKKKNAIA